MDAVCSAGLDEIRAVVEDEERTMLVAGGAERFGRGDQRSVVELLVTELDDVDPTAQGRRKQRKGIVAVRTSFEDEVQAATLEAPATGGSVHSASVVGCTGNAQIARLGS
jgi:hypothetical protein